MCITSSDIAYSTWFTTNLWEWQISVFRPKIKNTAYQKKKIITYMIKFKTHSLPPPPPTDMHFKHEMSENNLT
jgi:hypothetical protein